MIIKINFDFSVLLHRCLQKVTHTAACSDNSFALVLVVVDTCRMDLMASYLALVELGTYHKGLILMVVPDCYRDCS